MEGKLNEYLIFIFYPFFIFLFLFFTFFIFLFLFFTLSSFVELSFAKNCQIRTRWRLELYKAWAIFLEIITSKSLAKIWNKDGCFLILMSPCELWSPKPMIINRDPCKILLRFMCQKLVTFRHKMFKQF